jgi:hypothetical protein
MEDCLLAEAILLAESGHNMQRTAVTLANKECFEVNEAVSVPLTKLKERFFTACW